MSPDDMARVSPPGSSPPEFSLVFLGSPVNTYRSLVKRVGSLVLVCVLVSLPSCN